MVRPLLAKLRIFRRTNTGGKPCAPFFIQHRVVMIRLAVPDRFSSPIWRRRHRVRFRRGSLGVAHRVLDFGRLVLYRVQHRDEVRTEFGCSIDRPVGVDRWVALVGRNLVVEISRGTAPVPQSNDHVALDSLRPRRLRFGQLAGGDAIGPISP